jgi:hypothetical protein
MEIIAFLNVDHICRWVEAIKPRTGYAIWRPGYLFHYLLTPVLWLQRREEKRREEW